MADGNTSNKVLIVGAGISGLTLAQSLRKHNIPFEIFERDATQRSRKQGWAIALIECLDGLAEHLPSDLGDMYQTSVNAGINEADKIALVDMDTGATLTTLGAKMSTPGQLPMLRAGREAFRRYLWNHIPVSTGKRFSHYAEDDDGVTVYFEDGTNVRGAVLIGADGASSHVRTQLLGPKAAAEVSRVIPIFGECTLTREQYAPFAAVANAGFIAVNSSTRMACGRRSISPDGETADYFFSVMFPSDDPSRDSAWAQSATKEQLFDKCMKLVDGLPTLISSIITLTGPEGMVTPPARFLEFVPPDEMPRSRVTLLGDAAHAMTPFKGAGANTAVEDAIDMVNLLSQRPAQIQPQEGSGSVDDRQSWLDTVAAYNKVMVRRGRYFVLGSRDAGNSASVTIANEGRVWNPSTSMETRAGQTIATGA